MSIRLRLTLLFTALVVVVLAGFSAALYAGQAGGTRRMVETGLRAATARLLERQAHHPFGPSDPRPAGQPRPPLALYQTRSPAGEIVDRSPLLGASELPLSEAALAAVQAGETWTEVTRLDDEPVLVLSAPVGGSDGMPTIVQTAASLALLEEYLAGLRNRLVLISVLSAAAAFAAGWLLAGEALRPIDRIARTAREIGLERDFSRRVEHAGPNDEVGRLARTFNDMLAELEAAFVGLEDALANQRRFVADASHELRTPLTTVRGNAELLRLEPPIADPDRAAAVADIVAETERLMRLVSDLLLLARTDAAPSLQLEPVPVAPLLAAAARQARTLDPDREVQVQVAGAPVAMADREALAQVLTNLVANAVHHTPSDAAVTLRAAASRDGVTVSVADTGPGIDPAFLPRAFERFERGSATRTGPGTGLGLAIAKSLVEAQHGAIEVESEPGHGTTFTLRLAAAPSSGPA